jgi:SAM-dependent methyltransferase
VDTLFLAKLVGNSGKVHGFDIQRQALDQARARLEKELQDTCFVHLHLRSHDRLAESLPQEERGNVAAAMFNLGYLPGADPSVITVPETTLPALREVLAWLRPGGIVTIVLYPGHEGGQEEADAVTDWAAALPQSEAQVLTYRFINQIRKAPYLLAVEKRG